MIRNLRMDDLEPMYEWMHDLSVVENLQANFMKLTREDVKGFIEKAISGEDKSCVHFAITDESDEYFGTISLKNINYRDKNAEYAIVTHSKAHGKGYAQAASKDILNYAFNELGLEKVYLYVSVTNIPANKFYNKMNFFKEGVFRKHMMIKGQLEDIVWYSILKDEFIGDK